MIYLMTLPAFRHRLMIVWRLAAKFWNARVLRRRTRGRYEEVIDLDEREFIY